MKRIAREKCKRGRWLQDDLKADRVFKAVSYFGTNVPFYRVYKVPLESKDMNSTGGGKKKAGRTQKS